MKILITQDCAAPAMEGTQHLVVNVVVELEPDTVRAIVHAGKGLYVDPKDDPSRIKSATAPEARVAAVRAAMKADMKSPAKAADKTEG